MTYRPEIDGLRAIAVLAVVIYHSKLFDLTGGFVGVDVFFVISGYLITSNIVAEQLNGNFSLPRFYDRRARRLLPVLLGVLAVSSYYAWAYLLPSDLIEYSQSLLAALGFASNIFFYFLDNYHSVESAAKPLLHSWSLGVEEQFYLIFPLILIAVSRSVDSVKILLIAIIALGSIGFAQYASSALPDFNFYLLPSRMWELLTGALLAFFVRYRKTQSKPLLASALSIGGLGLISLSIIYFSSSTQHPSAVTLAPVLGAVGVIGWGARCKVTSRIIGSQLLVWVGRLSYSLYLWHFPVFAFATIKSGVTPLDRIDKLELLTLTFALSCVSYYCVEKPFRNRKFVSNRVTYTLLATMIISLATWSYKNIANSGYESRLGDIESIFHGADRKDSFLYKDGKKCVFNPQNTNSCRFDDFKSAKKIIAMGDSHSNMLSVPLYKYANEKGFNFYNMILSHCPYIEDAWRHTGFKAKCETSQMDAVRDYIATIEPAIIIYTARWPMYLNPDRFDNGEGGVERSLFFPLKPSVEAEARGDSIDSLIIKTFLNMANAGHKVVIVYPTPEVGWHVPKLVKAKLEEIPSKPLGRKRAFFEKTSITTSYEIYKKRSARTKSILDQIKHTNIYKVLPEKIFCSEDTGRCVTHNKKRLFYYDDDHLSQAGASLVVDAIDKILF